MMVVVVINTKGATMDQGDYAMYHISATGHVKGVLEKAGLPSSYISQRGDTFSIPRLCTFWRGDEAEQAWQNGLRVALLAADNKAELIIAAEPWQMLPGYPQGEIDQEKEVSA